MKTHHFQIENGPFAPKKILLWKNMQMVTGKVDYAKTAEIAGSTKILLFLPNQTFTSHYNLCPWYQPLIRKLCFKLVKKVTFCQSRGFVVQSKSAESAEIFKSCRFFVVLQIQIVSNSWLMFEVQCNKN